MPSDTATANGSARPAGTSTDGGRQPGGGHSGHQDQDPAGLLTAAATTLAGSSGTAAGSSSMDMPSALASITSARRLAAELEDIELASIDAARGSGATWAQIAVAMGARNRQTAQKRHADLARRRPRPPAVDTPGAILSRQPQARHGDRPAATPRTPGPAPDREQARPPDPVMPSPAAETAAAPAAPPAPGQRKRPLPEITGVIIREGRYDLVRAPGHHETRAWHVMVSGTRVGTVRPTWRGERTRPGWEAADNTGLALPTAATGRVTAAGNARTRDAAAVSLLHALQRQQQNGRKRKHPR